jgi:hypothetical protein
MLDSREHNSISLQHQFSQMQNQAAFPTCTKPPSQHTQEQATQEHERKQDIE